MMLAVPVTEASSSSIYPPFSPFSARSSKMSLPASKWNVAPRRWSPKKWVSIRRRPILSPPGLLSTALPKRATSGPMVRTLPRRVEQRSRYSSLRRYSRLMLSAWKVISPLPWRVTFTPMSCNRHMRLFTSTMSGTFSSLTASEVRSVAQITCRASFLAPCGVISPFRRCPPSMMNDGTVVFFLWMVEVPYSYIRLISQG